MAGLACGDAEAMTSPVEIAAVMLSVGHTREDPDWQYGMHQLHVRLDLESDRGWVWICRLFCPHERWEAHYRGDKLMTLEWSPPQDGRELALDATMIGVCSKMLATARTHGIPTNLKAGSKVRFAASWDDVATQLGDLLETQNKLYRRASELAAKVRAETGWDKPS